ncbi:hypothetical protein CR194_08800 [Salipaludibacillus keqinensis]|uniref:YhcN/YlaJ family sporulation lipoprotein n=1 Tax=Salipaludibacillus keqinensis TaxID=2045207 RepID=A0A323TD41_9BACI|nr:YhcN/YlaJ family sporulation lipoprotein [Salipaludibacillus keqinensis]PYZ93282.1 hypothetical protein CR194_08800 [Salipaludibacillus keqinensis]
MSKNVVMTILLSSLIIAGCQTNGDNGNSSNTIEGQTTDGSRQELQSFNEVADHLAELAVRVPEVNHATAVVLGPYGIVGINVDGDLDQSHVGSIKYQVAETLADDPYGANAAITADPDVVNRIADMQREVRDGQPLDAIADEFAAIFGRILPVVPTDEHLTEDPLESNSKDPSNENRKELEDTQRKQSKGKVGTH